ncbi:hypothetical protein REH70_09565 [Cellulomonas sp. ATA003]|nr:hypothetical protein [Cellulomonas sp. ATA003]WNB87317.1 hypothetical protein REH70_09565 [Cellulomonas sp. ATA003]
MALITPRAAATPRRRSGSASYWLYLIPIAIGFTAIVGAPFVANVAISLFRWQGGLALSTGTASGTTST